MLLRRRLGSRLGSKRDSMSCVVGGGVGVAISRPEKFMPGIGPEAKGKSPAAVKASARFRFIVSGIVPGSDDD